MTPSGAEPERPEPATPTGLGAYVLGLKASQARAEAQAARYRVALVEAENALSAVPKQMRKPAFIAALKGGRAALEEAPDAQS